MLPSHLLLILTFPQDLAWQSLLVDEKAERLQAQHRIAQFLLSFLLGGGWGIHTV